MTELHFYRASPLLAERLRAYTRAAVYYRDAIVRPFVELHPNNEPVQSNWTKKVIGFRDGKPNDPPPEGLSRSQKRNCLIPKRGRAGDYWHSKMIDLNESKPLLSGVFEEFDIPREVMRPELSKIFMVDFADFGDDDVLIYLGCELEPVPAALTPIKRSEGYAIQERYREAHGGE